MADYTTTGLLASIRRRAMLPSSASTGTADADLIGFANEVLQSYLVPFIMDVRENYLQARTPKEYAVTSGQASYRLPSRAIGNKLREVLLLDAGGSAYNLAEVDEEAQSRYALAGRSLSFFLSGAYLTLLPTPNSTVDTLRLDYYLRPSELVSDATAWATVSSVATDRTSLVISGAVTGLTTGAAFDVVKASSPFDVVAQDQTATVAGTTLTFTVPTDVDVGDYVALADTSPVPTIPAELHALLAQATACKVLEALGDSTGLGNAEAKLQKEMEAARTLISPRVDGETETIGGGFLQRTRGRWW